MWLLRLLLSLIVVAGIAAVSRIPYGDVPSHGVLRLSWKTSGEKVRIETAQQAENVPAHMRAAGGFEEKMRDYQLSVKVDDKVWLDRLMRPPGLRHDRPISVFEEMALPPGEHTVHLKFWPVPEQEARWKPEILRTVRIERGAIETITLTDAPPAGDEPNP